MNRYLSSFAISSAIYFAAVATLFYFLNSDVCNADTQIKEQRVVKISLLDLQKEEQPSQAQEIQKNELPLKAQKEPLLKTEARKTLKTVPLPHAVKKNKKHSKDVKLVPNIDTEPLKEHATKNSKLDEKSPQKSADTTHLSSTQNNLAALQEMQEREKKFFLHLKELINQNKSYPNSARRRGIQGDVEVKFCVLENGKVQGIKLLSGKSIFEKSAHEAIQKSFPIEVDKKLFSFPKEFTITIAYILK